MTTEYTSKYWICNDCAKNQGLVAPDWPITCIVGSCGHCEKDETVNLTPVHDYSNPKDKNHMQIWD